MATFKNTAINDTGYLRIPVGTTAQRVTTVSGDMRYNTTRGMIEIHNGASWVGIGQLEATGGNSVVTSGGYKIHTFTSPGTFIAASGSSSAELLVIAGGGSGGSGTGAGGGAGGVLYNGAFAISSGSYSVVVGSGGPFRPGGVTQGISGSPSVFGPQTAVGGGYGGNTGPPGSNAGVPGGSGGGAALYPGSPNSAGNTIGSGTPGQGFAGGTSAGYGGGGGGGIGGAGQPGNGGYGGPGANYSTTGSSASYAGGGSGSTSGNIPAPGSGGGGAGLSQGGPGCNATYYGGGGGGSWDYGNAGAGAGYQGIVVVRYPYG